MALTDAQKRKIEEEERYRAQVKEELKKEKPKKKGSGCFGVLLIFFIIIMAVFLFGANGSNKNSSSNSSTKPSTEKLNASVIFTGTQFEITNQNSTDWEGCRFTVNGKYNYPSKTSDWVPSNRLGPIKAGETVKMGAATFTLNDGTRFNPFSTKPQNLSADCTGTFGYWEFN
jgi:hypothetical protein